MIFGWWLATVPARTATDAPQMMSEIARDLDLQTKMPSDDEPKAPDIPWSNLRWHLPGTVAEWILWGALAAGLGFAIYAFRDSLPFLARRKTLRPRAVATVLPADESIARMAEAGEDADELARRGLFAEAMHMLLLRSVSELRTRLNVSIADALTSREIASRLALSEAARASLADMIGRVEPVHFGTRVPAPEDYWDCRSSFDRLVAALVAPAAPA